MGKDKTGKIQNMKYKKDKKCTKYKSYVIFIYFLCVVSQSLLFFELVPFKALIFL